MQTPEVLHSLEDKSINHIVPLPAGGAFESRFVQRDAAEVIVYLSSTAGCNLSCRFCWLTQLNQTNMTPATTKDYAIAAAQILDIAMVAHDLRTTKTIHFNFMARGDVLANFHFVTAPNALFRRLTRVARQRFPKANVKFKISTIFPNSLHIGSGLRLTTAELRTKLIEPILEVSPDSPWTSEFYYSLYSLRPEFRKKWLPKALDPEFVGEIFRGTDHGLRLHHALIAGVNDTEEDVALIHDWLERYDLKVKFNLVRYNAYSLKCGTEADLISQVTYLNQLALSHRVEVSQIVPRVGYDIKASCGMFVED